MTDDTPVTTVAWVQDLGDGNGGIWQDGVVLSEADGDRRQEAVASISRVTSSVPPEDHGGGVVSYVRRSFGRRTEIVVEIPRKTLDVLGRPTLLTIHLSAPRAAAPARVLDALQHEVDAVRARGVTVDDLRPDAAHRLSQSIHAVQAPGCLMAPFTARSIE